MFCCRLLYLHSCCVLVCVFWGMVRWWVGGLLCGPGICVSWFASGWGVGLVPLGRFGPYGGMFCWPFRDGASFVGSLCFFCSVFAMPL